MHYNLHERIKIRRNIPYKKITFVVVAVVVAVGLYLVLSHKDAGLKNPPAVVQQKPA
jgi:hypothetical protein